MPIDSVFEFEPNEGEKHKLQVSYQKYVEWEQSMNQAFEIAKIQVAVANIIKNIITKRHKVLTLM